MFRALALRRSESSCYMTLYNQTFRYTKQTSEQHSGFSDIQFSEVNLFTRGRTEVSDKDSYFLDFMLYTDLINMEVRVRRNDRASRVVNSFTRQVPSKATLLSFQPLYKSSGSFFGLIKRTEIHVNASILPPDQ